VPADYASHLSELIASDHRADALRYFMTAGVQVPRIFVSMMRFMPAWKRLKAIAHTLDYDTAILGPEFGSGKPLPTDRWTSVTAPAVVIDGGKSPEWMRNTQRALADLLGAEYRTLEGQTHMVKPKALAPVLAEFLAGSVQRSVAA
jgi:hypothetical protein